LYFGARQKGKGTWCRGKLDEVSFFGPGDHEKEEGNWGGKKGKRDGDPSPSSSSYSTLKMREGEGKGSKGTVGGRGKEGRRKKSGLLAHSV